MIKLPTSLVVEVRLAFQQCARQHVSLRRTRFSTFQPLLKKRKPQSNKDKDSVPIQVVHHRVLQARRDAEARAAQTSSESRELVPLPNEEKSLDSGRKVDVPLRVIPKAEITPNLTLTPKERLHIEQLTRRLPPRSEARGMDTSLVDDGEKGINEHSLQATVTNIQCW
jgi:hypothetical protein